MINVEASFIDWLSNKGYQSYADVPHQRPNEFVCIEKTGCSINDTVVKSTISCQCWATSRLRASEMAMTIADSVNNFSNYLGIFSAKISNMYNYPDVESGSPRYQLIIDVVHK